MPRNAWSADRYAGGSSSGSAVAVASGMALGGVGTDTSGSIRHPAALNGVTGLKVSFGRVPIGGERYRSPRLSTRSGRSRGPRGTARCCCRSWQATTRATPNRAGSRSRDTSRRWTVLSVACGSAGRSTTSSARETSPTRSGAGSPRPSRDCAKAGAAISEVSLPTADMARIANNIVLLSEASAYHRDNSLTRWTDYGGYLRGLLARGGRSPRQTTSRRRRSRLCSGERCPR